MDKNSFFAEVEAELARDRARQFEELTKIQNTVTFEEFDRALKTCTDRFEIGMRALMESFEQSLEPIMQKLVESPLEEELKLVLVNRAMRSIERIQPA